MTRPLKPTCYSGGIYGAVGLDLGLRAFATLSTGEKIAPPQYDRKAQEKRGRLDHQISWKELDSRNREKARLEEYISNQRRDFHYKVSHRLVGENCFIGLEDLNVQSMLANRRLAKSMGDAGWSTFVTLSGYKGACYGCQVAKIRRWYPSIKTCSVWQVDGSDAAESTPVAVPDLWYSPSSGYQRSHEHLEPNYRRSCGKSRLGTACKTII